MCSSCIQTSCRSLQTIAADKKVPCNRLGAAATQLALAKTLGKPAEPTLFAGLTWTLDLVGDKESNVASVASETCKFIIEELIAGVSVRDLLTLVFPVHTLFQARSPWRSPVLQRLCRRS